MNEKSELLAILILIFIIAVITCVSFGFNWTAFFLALVLWDLVNDFRNK